MAVKFEPPEALVKYFDGVNRRQQWNISKQAAITVGAGEDEEHDGVVRATEEAEFGGDNSHDVSAFPLLNHGSGMASTSTSSTNKASDRRPHRARRRSSMGEGRTRIRPRASSRM